jgi:dihydrofolate reductase
MIVALFAVDQAGGMGWKGSLPWPHNKDDMQWFKKTTQNQVVVMGRRTWESPDMPKPLPGRHNILFTNNFIDRDDIEQIKGDVCEALKAVEKTHKGKDIFVIGGQNLLEQSRPVINKVMITKINGEYPCDSYIDLNKFLKDLTLINTINLGSCLVEEFQNERISSSSRTNPRKRKEKN